MQNTMPPQFPPFRKVRVANSSQHAYSPTNVYLTEHLQQRQHDSDEEVRIDVVQAVVGAAKRALANVSGELLDCVKERTLDKKVIHISCSYCLLGFYLGCIMYNYELMLTQLINIILFVLKVQPNATYKLFARKKKQTEVHRKKVQ